MSADFVIAQLAREPVPGEVKTRLLSALSPQRAAALHAAMVLRTAGRLSEAGPLQLWVAGDVGNPLFQECLDAGAGSLHPQPGGDLGAKMQHIAAAGLDSHERVILVGSDSPELDADYVLQAVRALDAVDVVLGPALDGGYVLLGLKILCRELFADMPWGSDAVLRQSVEALEETGRSYRLLDARQDIDRPEDLRHLPEDLDW